MPTNYFVTYCVMDSDARANPLGHSCLLFSQQKHPDSPIEVVNSIGFYSQPSTTTNPVISFIKKIIGLNVDLQDGHGVLKKEAMHEIDGKGLQGISFKVSQKQFIRLNKRYQQLMAEQHKVITELNEELVQQGITPNGFTRYMAEKKKAEAEMRLPRLKPFHISMSLSVNGLDSSESYNCKDHALELLTEQGIISAKTKEMFTINKATKAFPIYSQITLEPIRLISTGIPIQKRSKRTGAFFYNHAWGINSLCWASPMNLLGAPSQQQPHAQELQELFDRMRNTEYLLQEALRIKEKDQEYSKEYLAQMKIQVKRVQNLAYLFHRSHENQDTQLLTERMQQANKVLDEAVLSLHLEQMNHSFLLRALASTTLHEALLGMLITVVIAATLSATPVGLAFLALSASMTAYQFYGFYQEEKQWNVMQKTFQPALDDASSHSALPLS